MKNNYLLVEERDLIDKIEHEGKVYAIILRRNTNIHGVNFFTSKENPIQLGFIKSGKGAEIKPHIHKRVPRTINVTQELLHVEKGKVKVNFYNEYKKPAGETILEAGDTLLHIQGGHGFKMLEDTEAIIVKQGPYPSIGEDKNYI